MTNRSIFVIIYNNERSYVTITHQEPEPSFEEFVQAVTQKIGAKELSVYDEKNTRIDEDSFSLLIQRELISEFFIKSSPSRDHPSPANPSEGSSSAKEKPNENLSSANPSEASSSAKQKPNEKIEVSLCEQVVPLLRYHFVHQRNILVKGSDLLKLKEVSDRDRSYIIKIVCDHLFLHRPSPKKDDKIAWAQATIELFPMLRVDGSKTPYEAVYSSRGKGGWLGNRIKTVQAKQRDVKKAFHQGPNVTECNDDDDALDDLCILRHELIKLNPKRNLQKILDLTKDTFPLRQRLLNTPEKNTVLIQYPRFIDTPNLVQEEFTRLFPDAAIESVREFLTDPMQDLLIRVGKKNPCDKPEGA